MDTKTVYKCFVTYLVKLFSKYIKEGDSDLLVHLKSVLSNENLFSLSVPINYAITNEFIKPCLKKVILLINVCSLNFQFIITDGKFSKTGAER